VEPGKKSRSVKKVDRGVKLIIRSLKGPKKGREVLRASKNK